MDAFSTLRNWWAFFFETLIGRLQRIPTNHQIGQLERTMLHSFNKGASVRQWLLRPDCPPLLAYCLKILDNAYHYQKRGHPTADAEEEAQETVTSDIVSTFMGNDSQTQDSFIKYLIQDPPPSELLSACGGSDIRCFSRIPAPHGFYAISDKKAIGNSYICLKSNDGWDTAQIQHIFDCYDGKIQMAIRHSKTLNIGKDPFSMFWEYGFEAKMVSSSFKTKLEIVSKDSILGHAARWEVSAGKIVALSLCRD
ncbi:hypothetical protein VKT23_020011 [Stygiomarasmius scandens]|uniref:Uncharacterized protein n=1 Tax=Marasmiellus scandens TaxID=2682957 RepID=A0ABR1IK35_9AGAR